jgi:hypothetical protein
MATWHIDQLAFASRRSHEIGTMAAHVGHIVKSDSAILSSTSQLLEVSGINVQTRAFCSSCICHSIQDVWLRRTRHMNWIYLVIEGKNLVVTY